MSYNRRRYVAARLTSDLLEVLNETPNEDDRYRVTGMLNQIALTLELEDMLADDITETIACCDEDEEMNAEPELAA